jgi:single-strand DNA-binding protein
MWFQVSTFSKLAEICKQYLKKGRQVAVTGSINIHEYCGKDGAVKTTVNVVATQVDFLAGCEQSKSTTAPATACGDYRPSDDDIPF